MILLNLLLKLLSDIIFISIFCILSLGLGLKIWHYWFDSPTDPIDLFQEGLFCVLIGLGLFSLMILVIGLCGLLKFWVILSIFILIFIFVFREIKDYVFGSLKPFGSCLSSLTRSGPFVILSPFLIISCIWLLIASRIPPVFYDALVYHLGVPSQYIIHQAIRFMPYSFHSHHPFLIQNLFAICLLLGGHGTAKLLIFMFVLFNMATLMLFGIRFFSRTAAWLSGVIFLVTPTILVVGALINADLGFSVYTLLALYALCMWTTRNEKRWLFISAIMTGFSLGTKYIGIIFCFGLCLFCLSFVLMKSREGLKTAFHVILIYSLIAISIGCGWYVKNLVWTKNPFYPKWADTWGIPEIPEKNLNAFYASAHAFDSKDPTRNSVLSLPWDLIYHPVWFGVGGTIGPLFLILLPLIFIPDQKNQIYLILLIYCVLYYFAWALTFRMARFAIPLLAIMILLAVNTLTRILHHPRKYLKSMLIILLVIGFSYNLYYGINQFSRVYTPWPYLTGKMSEDSYLASKIRSYPVFTYMNHNLPSQSRILFLGETVNFYCYRDVISPTAFDINPIVPLLKESKSKEEVLQALKDMGVTHLLVNFPEMERLDHAYKTFGFTERDLKRLGEVFQSSRPLIRQNGIILVEFPYQPVTAWYKIS